MSRSERNSREAWDHTRQKGPFRYIFIRSLLLWGLPMSGALFAAGYLTQFGFRFHDLLLDAVQGLVIRSIVSGVIFGLVMGLWSWKVHEKAFLISRTDKLDK